MTKTLIVNFTGDSYHWGCHGTSYALACGLLKSGPVDIIPVTKNAVIPITSVLESKAYGQSKEFLRNHQDIVKKIEACDRIVVNGEGTLHKDRPGPRGLLAMMSFAKNIGKAVFLLNHSIFPSAMEENPELENAYADILSEMDGIASRESLSQSWYTKKGINSIESFDLLPLFIKTRHEHVLGHKESRNCITISGGVEIPSDEIIKLIDFLIIKFKGKKKIIYVYGASDKSAGEDGRVAHCILQKNYEDASVKVFEAKSFEEYLGAIQYTDILITGRFHYAITAACTATPAILIDSNTPKVSAIANDLKYDAEVLNPNDIDIARVDVLLDSFNAGSRKLLFSTTLDELALRSLKNFSILSDTRLPLCGDAESAKQSRQLDWIEMRELSRANRHYQMVYYYRDTDENTRKNFPRHMSATIAKSLVMAGMTEEGFRLFNDVLARHPDFTHTHGMLIRCLLHVSDFKGLIAALQNAELVCGKDLGLISDIVNHYILLDRFEDAARMVQQGLAIEPDNTHLLTSAASIELRYKKNIDNALNFLSKVLSKSLSPDPHNIAARRDIGICHIFRGNFGEGFEIHARASYQNPIWQANSRPYTFPSWTGGSIDGKLLILPETVQGIGFELLACTFLAELEKQGFQLVFEMTEKLIPVLAPLFPKTQFIPHEKKGFGGIYNLGIAAQVTLLQMCSILRRSAEDFCKGWLPGVRFAMPPHQKLPLRLGISWFTTNPAFGKGRSTPVREWMALFNSVSLPTEWINLQYGDVKKELQDLENSGGPRIVHKAGVDFFHDIKSLVDTMKTVDAVISIDNSTLFFAGLLGKPTFAILPYSGHWIWGMNDIRSLWFPNIELYRKPLSGEIEPLFTAIGRRLLSFFEESQYIEFYRKPLPGEIG